MPAERARDDGSSLSLLTLLSRALLAFTIEFEREWELSLAISSNVLRVLDEKGVPLRGLPLLTGVSKEAVSMALGFLKERKYVTFAADPNVGRTKLVRITAKGREAQVAYVQRLGAIEEQWHARFGEDTIRGLRNSLQPLVGETDANQSPLFRGIEPDPEGWRANVQRPNTLPHHPMVLHRGGFPDGS